MQITDAGDGIEFLGTDVGSQSSPECRELLPEQLNIEASTAALISVKVDDVVIECIYALFCYFMTIIP